MASIAAPTRSARSGSMANNCAAALVSSGRRRLPPPTAACRIASYKWSRASPLFSSSREKKLSISADRRFDSASKSALERSMISTPIERGRARRLAVGAEGDLLDARLGSLQPRFAMALQAVAFLVQLDRLVQRRLAALEQPDDLLEPRKRRLEAQFLSGRGCFHPRLQ